MGMDFFFFQEVSEFQIDEVFRVVEVGTVVGGLLTKGVITEGMNLLIGEGFLFIFSFKCLVPLALLYLTLNTMFLNH